MQDLPGPGLEAGSPALAGSFFFLEIYLFCLFYLWLRWIFVAVRRLSLVAVSGGLLFIAACVLLIAVASLVAKHGL